jgi:hypothetical protein
MPNQTDQNIQETIKVASELGNSSFGSNLGFGLAFLGIYAGLALMMFGSKWDGHLFDKKGCVQIQEIKNQLYKVDTCDIKVLPVKIKPEELK